MGYDKLCYELLQIAKTTTDEKTKNSLFEIYSDITKNGIMDNEAQELEEKILESRGELYLND